MVRALCVPVTPHLWTFLSLNSCSGLNCVPQKDRSNSSPQVFAKVTLFGNRGFVDIITSLGSQDAVILVLEWDLCPMMSVLIREKRRKLEMHRQSRDREEGPMKIEAEIGGMQPQAKDQQEPPEAGEQGRNLP